MILRYASSGIGLLVTLVVATAIGAAEDGPAAGPERGKSLHEANCVRCHGSEVYTRANRKVTSRSGLDAQVRRCDTLVGTSWLDDEIQDVVDFLSRTYYKFN